MNSVPFPPKYNPAPAQTTAMTLSDKLNRVVERLDAQLGQFSAIIDRIQGNPSAAKDGAAIGGRSLVHAVDELERQVETLHALLNALGTVA